jgi:putative transposase
VHLLRTPDSADGPSHLMQHVGQRYVQYVNRTYQRTGTFWERRFRSCLVDAESYLLACQRYIELNPVRAQMVAHPVDYPWSIYRGNAQGAGDGLLCPHACYQALGRDKAARQVTYRELLRDDLEGGFLDAMRQATHGGYCLGSDRFKQEVAAMLKRRVERGQAGRPNKKEANDTPQGTP